MKTKELMSLNKTRNGKIVASIYDKVGARFVHENFNDFPITVVVGELRFMGVTCPKSVRLA